MTYIRTEAFKQRMSAIIRGIGYKHSEETKTKMRLKRIGRKLSDTHKEKLRIRMFGNQHGKGRQWTEEGKQLVINKNKAFWRNSSEEFKQKKREKMIGNSFGLGRKHTSEELAKMSLFQRGKKMGADNPNWQGGIMNLPYAIGFNKYLKEKIRKRDDYKCQKCGVPQNECIRSLDTHHIDYDKENCSEANLISLCTSCNIQVNKNREYWTAYFTKLLISRIKFSL